MTDMQKQDVDTKRRGNVVENECSAENCLENSRTPDRGEGQALRSAGSVRRLADLDLKLVSLNTQPRIID